jgi:hypothetical protein
VCERIWRKPSRPYIRVLPEALGVRQKGYTQRLQRILCDFSWEQSFREANQRLREHYGFELCAERIRQTAEEHAHRIDKAHRKRPAVSTLPEHGADWIVTSADGTMIRIAHTGRTKQGQRTRTLEWKEARLCAAQAQGSTEIAYEATLGDVHEWGQCWAHAVKHSQWGARSNIHAVTDGAPCLREQAAQNLGQRHRHTLDLYHVCEYLAAAASTCAHKESAQRWLIRHKNMLLKGKLKNVLANLKKNIEAPDTDDAPVRCAYRYLNSRIESLDYPFAIKHDLPVGSGIIEGGNRHVIQKRLKGPGMAWSAHNAQAMMKARCLKCSGNFDQYWQECAKIAA